MPARRPAADVSALGRRVERAVRRRLRAWPLAPDPTGFYAAVDPGPGPRGAVLGATRLAVADGDGWRVRYRTLDAAGRPVAASMALAVPAGLAPRPRPVAVWVHGARGVAPGCGPSRLGLDAWYVPELLRAGVVVVAPDLTGLGMDGALHPYLHGTTAGRSVLDAARAARALTTTGAGDVVALAGHSAGGFAVLWANELAAGPDGDGLDVRVAVPMSPVVDLPAAMDHYARGAGQGVFPVLLAATWPDVEPVESADVLTAAARARLGHLHTDRLDRLEWVFRGPAARWVHADGFRTPAWAAALAAQSPGQRPGAAPTSIVHGAADDATLVQWSRDLAARTGVELLEVAGADHMAVGPLAAGHVVATILDAVR